MKRKVRYFVEPQGKLTRAAACVLALSMLLRLLWCLIWPSDAAARGWGVHVLLPLLCCLLFILCLLIFGRKALWLSFFPALGGVLFFLLKATTFVWWHQLLCTLLYLLVAALYGAAVFGLAPIKKLLIPLFGLPLAFHIFVEDLFLNRSSMSAGDWLQEGSVLCIMAALLCVSLAMKKDGSFVPKEEKRRAAAS